LDEPYDQFGGFILVEPGDNPASLEAESGCLITTGLFITPAIEVTCAIYTASTGKLDVLRRLVEAGADLDKEATGGYTALDSASTLPVLKYLRSVMAAA